MCRCEFHCEQCAGGGLPDRVLERAVHQADWLPPDRGQLQASLPPLHAGRVHRPREVRPHPDRLRGNQTRPVRHTALQEKQLVSITTLHFEIFYNPKRPGRFCNFSKNWIKKFKLSIFPQLRVPEKRTIAPLKGLILGFHLVR